MHETNGINIVRILRSCNGKRGFYFADKYQLTSTDSEDMDEYLFPHKTMLCSY